MGESATKTPMQLYRTNNYFLVCALLRALGNFDELVSRSFFALIELCLLDYIVIRMRWQIMRQLTARSVCLYKGGQMNQSADK